ncbi:RNA polymerase sigma factor [Fusibacter ferrireducens]|uniref:RNA polymerase sigma factor n=1 Tax=Fusibacter ferrireducens TaxID=2785058 RepID=A0ABR9ZPI9_9FIRM|nr:RNA polymerase sigma factor [Fusibacter ferrireducens]MBF4692354.1 sigma-70 family RNA polymerase sigma factor [Fusibacter ferrireducens]
MVAFETVYEQNYTKLYNLAYRMTGNLQDAEDVLQTAFLNAYKAYDQFREESHVATWLYQIVLNESKHYFKKINKMPVDQYAESNDLTIREVYGYINSFGTVEDEVMYTATKEACLQLFMSCLSSKLRAVFTLRVVLDFSTEEVAEILQIKPSTVKVYLHRARTFITDNVKGKCSLINPDNPCKCSSWIKYALETGLKIENSDIKIIQKKEALIKAAFKEEVSALYKVMLLYNTEVVPKPYESFKAHVKVLMASKKYKLLNYTAD